MDPKPTALLDRIEHHRTCNIAGCRRCYLDGDALFSTGEALEEACVIIREQDAEIERLCARIADLERATLVDDRCLACGLLHTTNGLNDMRDSSMLCDCTDESDEPVAGSFGETVLDAGTVEPSATPIRTILLG